MPTNLVLWAKNFTVFWMNHWSFYSCLIHLQIKQGQEIESFLGGTRRRHSVSQSKYWMNRIHLDKIWINVLFWLIKCLTFWLLYINSPLHSTLCETSYTFKVPYFLRIYSTFYILICHSEWKLVVIKPQKRVSHGFSYVPISPKICLHGTVLHNWELGGRAMEREGGLGMSFHALCLFIFEYASHLPWLCPLLQGHWPSKLC